MSFDLVVRTVEKQGSHSGSLNGWVLWDCEGIIMLIAKVSVFILLGKNDQFYKSFARNFLWALQFSFILPFILQILWLQELRVSVSVGSCITLYLFNFDSHIFSKFPMNASTETYRYKSTRKQISASFTVHCKFWLHITQVDLNIPVRQIGVDTLWKDCLGGLVVCVNHVCSKGIAFGWFEFCRPHISILVHWTVATRLYTFSLLLWQDW